MENKLKEEFLKMEIPDMKEDIMKNVKKENAPREKRRIRPAAMIVIAALVLILAVMVGAVTGGMLKLNSGIKLYFKDNEGNLVRPTGFHLDEDVDAHLSEKALENIAPYVFSSGAVPTLYETGESEAMEDFLDRTLYLPELTKDEASLYRLRALGENGDPVTLYVQVVSEGEQSMDVYFRTGPINVIGGSDPVYYSHTLPDGTPVSIAVTESRKGGMTGHALYEHEEAVYHLRVNGKNTKTVLEKLRAILDTAE